MSLLRQAAPAGEITLPAGQVYRGTFGETVVSRFGAEGSPPSYHLWRLAGGQVVETVVSGIPADADRVDVADGDARSLILRYTSPEDSGGWQRWGIVDLSSGVFTRLPDRLDGAEGWEVSGFQLAGDSVLRLRMGRSKLDVYDRADLSAAPREVEAGAFGSESRFGVVGSTVLAVDPVNGGDNQRRGRPLFALTEPGLTEIMSPAADQIVPAPDGSVLVAGAAKYVEQGDLDWGIYRIREAEDGTIVRTRLTAVEPAPAEVQGLALGSGILTTATNSAIYEPSAVVGVFRSSWISNGATPSVVRSTRDSVITSAYDEATCHTGKDRCLRMFADGAGFHGPANGDFKQQTSMFANGSADVRHTVGTGSGRPELLDVSGRYGIVENGAQYITDFRTRTVLSKRAQTGAAVSGSTLWSSNNTAGTVQATRLPDGAVLESFTTPDGCLPGRLQATGRWVYWVCEDDRGGPLTAGVYDRVTKRSTGAPTGEVLLGDGYLVEEVEGVGLRLVDLRAGMSRRVLVPAAELGAWATGYTQFRGMRDSWTVDRFGGGVAYADDQQRVHIVPTGIPASNLGVIDSAVSAAAANWTGTWWLSKPAASWQVTIRNTAGTTLRTITGSSAHGLIQAAWDGKDTAGRAVADGAFTWTLTATPADRQGPALTVGNVLIGTTAPAVTGTVAVGSTVKASTGNWSPAPTSYAYQWAADGAAISGATGSTYPIPASMLGKRLTVTVTAKRAGHLSGVAKSAASAAVRAGAAPKASKAPAISGTLSVGSTVRATTGTWSPAPNSYAYQWAANGVAIKGATGSAYPIPASMLGKRLTVTVTAKRTGHAAGVAKSVSSVTVAKGAAPKATKKPKITGTAKVGKKVKVSVGAWSPKATSYRYEWRLNGKLIKGATASSLRLKSSMRGKKLTVTVIARRPGHTDGRATSTAVKTR
ncbi:FlgD immunoglobulin-like domain containing protein [Actinoplanes sp. NPDC023936]|uniref:FlgD immunoglobulin-like domain containing protein n=1 Tax=Actinoplanes sp. NPDC023936 TaxID=3154910 RepID=UPI0033D4AC59